jgi:glucan phosphorylase
VYYLSAEFLMGRSLLNTVYNLGLEGEYGKALQGMGVKLEEVRVGGWVVVAVMGLGRVVMRDVRTRLTNFTLCGS